MQKFKLQPDILIKLILFGKKKSFYHKYILFNFRKGSDITKLLGKNLGYLNTSFSNINLSLKHIGEVKMILLQTVQIIPLKNNNILFKPKHQQLHQEKAMQVFSQSLA